MDSRKHDRNALGRVDIVPANPFWPEYFRRERDRLGPLLGDIVGELQHFGSTSVPRICAKPIIDMMAPVNSLQRADELSKNLATVGYRKIEASFSKRRFFRKVVEGGGLAYHLHLVVSPTWPLKNELLLRDWLIRRPDVAYRYGKLKLELAEIYGDDMPRYTAGKTAFIRSAVNDARLSRGLAVECDWNE